MGFFGVLSVTLFVSEMKVSSIKQLATLRGSDRLERIMSEVEKFQNQPNTNKKRVGPIEIDPEYQLIVEANNLAVEIDNEISKCCCITIKSALWLRAFMLRHLV